MNPELYLAVGEDKELLLVQKGKHLDEEEQVHTDYNHLLVNVYHISTTESKIKITQPDQIMKGKVFHIDMDSLHKKITKKNIELVRSGKFTDPITDDNLKSQKDNTVVEHLMAKVMWVSPKPFPNGELNIKIWTETGLCLLLILEPKYHTSVEKDKVYRFIQIHKPKQWTSSSPLLKEVQLMLKTRSNTKIEMIKSPSARFKELGKNVGEVMWVDQKLVIFDQCVECWKAKWKMECRTDGCPQFGKTSPENPMFNLRMVVNTQEDKAITIKAWRRELVDLPKSFMPSLDPEVGAVIALEELERHFKEKTITYRPGNMEGKYLVVKDVAIKLPSSMDFN